MVAGALQTHGWTGNASGWFHHFEKLRGVCWSTAGLCSGVCACLIWIKKEDELPIPLSTFGRSKSGACGSQGSTRIK